MKKIYTLIATVLFTGSLSAQLVNNDFEDSISNPYLGYANLSNTSGWGANIYKPETGNPGEGSQSVKLETVVDAALNAAFSGINSDTIPGFIRQDMYGTMINPDGITLDYLAKYIPINGDSAFVALEVYDTLNAGTGDDLLLFQGWATIDSAVTEWTQGTVTMTAHSTNTGSANRLLVAACASIGALNGTSDPQPGSVLYVDQFVLNNYLGQDEELTYSPIHVFPNPADNELKFELNAETSVISIYASDGKLLLSQIAKGIQGSIVDISSLKSGMYFYTVTTFTGETVSNTFVKK